MVGEAKAPQAVRVVSSPSRPFASRSREFARIIAREHSTQRDRIPTEVEAESGEGACYNTGSNKTKRKNKAAVDCRGD